MVRKTKRAPILLETGQLWHTDKGYIEIVQLGKTLAHYRRSLTVGQKGIPVSLASIKSMTAMLQASDARLSKKGA